MARLWHPWAMVWFLDTRIVFINQSINQSTRRRRRRRAQSTGVALLPVFSLSLPGGTFHFPLFQFQGRGAGFCVENVCSVRRDPTQSHVGGLGENQSCWGGGEADDDDDDDDDEDAVGRTHSITRALITKQTNTRTTTREEGHTCLLSPMM